MADMSADLRALRVTTSSPQIPLSFYDIDAEAVADLVMQLHRRRPGH
jgi:hypothetical protein